jgi:hypothetical protein
MSNPRAIRVRWHAGHPPKPLGCRWCGHPPYAHAADSLPHRRSHRWEQPTSAQFSARMACRQRLGLHQQLLAGPARPAAVHPPAGHRPLIPGRVAENAPRSRSRAPDHSGAVHRRTPSPPRRGAAA